MASRCQRKEGTGIGFPPGFVIVADGEDDFGLGLECHKILIDVTTRGVRRGKITTHSEPYTVATGSRFFGRQLRRGFYKAGKKKTRLRFAKDLLFGCYISARCSFALTF